jgi:hypothetical protein
MWDLRSEGDFHMSQGTGQEFWRSVDRDPVRPVSADQESEPRCRGCGVAVSHGATLCSACDSLLVRNAVALSELAQEASLRGRALVALDRKRYPKLPIAKGRSVGPGLISWCPVLRAADARTLKRIIELAERAHRREGEA